MLGACVQRPGVTAERPTDGRRVSYSRLRLIRALPKDECRDMFRTDGEGQFVDNEVKLFATASRPTTVAQRCTEWLEECFALDGGPHWSLRAEARPLPRGAWLVKIWQTFDGATLVTSRAPRLPMSYLNLRNTGIVSGGAIVLFSLVAADSRVDVVDRETARLRWSLEYAATSGSVAESDYWLRWRDGKNSSFDVPNLLIW